CYDERKKLFFFQEEDGIRDRNVTGVQTCALPISAGGNDFLADTVTGDEPYSSTSALSWVAQREVKGGPDGALPIFSVRIDIVNRSEERRVGKEGTKEKTKLYVRIWRKET